MDDINAQTAAANELVATFTVLNVPQAGKFYRLKGISGNYIDATSIYNNADATSGQMSMKPENEANLAGTIFYLDEGNYFLNYATGTYVRQTSEIGAVGATKGAWSFAPSTRTLGKLMLSCTTTHNAGQNLHDNEGTRADRCSSVCGERHDWTIEEVTSLPVALKQVGDKAAWATLYAPVALAVPENVTAYYGVINNDEYLTLVEIESRVIPANEGVILCAETGGTYYFDVTDETNDITNNRLTGNVAAQINNQKTEDQIPYYTLQSDGSNVVFRQFNGDFKGFRAYLELTNGQGSISIRFEGTTDIEHSTLNPQPSTQIYDLLGRRVETITKGGIYIVNGKKVIK